MMFPSTQELKKFYEEIKWLFEISTFLGVLSALFLQLSIPNNSSLLMLQASFLFLFALSISYILICFWFFLIRNQTSNIQILVNGSIVTTPVFFIIFYLFKFIVSLYQIQLLKYYFHIKFGLLLIIGILFNKLRKKLVLNYGHNFLFTFIEEGIWILLLLMFTTGLHSSKIEYYMYWVGLFCLNYTVSVEKIRWRIYLISIILLLLSFLIYVVFLT